MSPNPKRSAHSKKLLANPKVLAALREGNARSWSDPERRALRVAAIARGRRAFERLKRLLRRRARREKKIVATVEAASPAAAAPKPAVKARPKKRARKIAIPAKPGETAGDSASMKNEAVAASQAADRLATPEGRALRADAERIVAARPDLEFHITDEDGTARTVKASDLLREADEDAAAAHELQLCITSFGEAAE